jgi:PPOX class probable F420-dependent enzyme
MAHKMTNEEIRSFMRQGSRTGMLATVRANGAPHVVPIWFDFDDETGEAVFVCGAGSLKARNMTRNPRVSIGVDVSEMPFAFARLDGIASLSTYDADPEAMLHWATETCRRYVGDDLAEEFGRRNAVPDELLVRVNPTRMIGATGIAD